LEKLRSNIKVNKSKIYFLFAFLLSWSQLAHSYIRNQTKTGIPLHWSSTSSTVDIFVNSQNDQGLSEPLVQSIAESSIGEWNGQSRINLRKNTTTGKDQADLNELYFSSDSSIFNGSGVVGITLVGFNESNGEIASADILISDNYFFSTDPTAANYLGNVITHEAGHFLGLGHGQVAGSTMFYALSRGQNKISDDDKAGLYSLYPNGDTTKGVLSGTVVGGKGLALVFGAHVQAISVKTGKVMGASVSELNGKFKIDGLPQDDQYLIYTSPIKQLGLPANYANVRSDFCESSAKYRGSFFQACGSSSEGFPEAVRLNSASVDTGYITIRCGLDTPPEYIQNKSVSSNFDINNYTGSGLGGSFVGFFSTSETQQSGVLDDFKINFSNVADWNAIYPNSNLYLELKVMNQAFYSALKANVSISVRRGLADVDVTPVTPKYSQGADGWVNIDTVMRVPISRSVPSDNDFEIKISPEIMDFTHYPSGIPFSKSDLLPSYTDMQEGLYFYLVTATVVKDNGNGTFTQVASKNDLLSDNTMCTDAINTYALTNFSAKGISSNSDRKKVAGCGTVVDSNDGAGGGGGPGGFMVGLLLCFIISYALSRYSKMA
jgi:predicted Zn-dependent protease